MSVPFPEWSLKIARSLTDNFDLQNKIAASLVEAYRKGLAIANITNTHIVKIEEECCRYCGGDHKWETCPKIKAIEYHDLGYVKRVEFRDTKPLVVTEWKA